MTMMGFEVKRRTEPDGSFSTWKSDHDGKEHNVIYDLPVLDNGHVVNGVKQWNWLWISALHTELPNPDGTEPWPTPCRVSIWSGAAGRWLDGEAPGVDAGVTGDFRGWSVPSGGKTSVVSLDGVELWIVVDNGFGPA